MVERGFHSPARRFGVILESAVEIAAVQCDWRGFRIAPCSRERDDATLPKIWTPSVAAISPMRTVEASDESTRRRQQIPLRQTGRYRILGRRPCRHLRN